ncbi:MAG: P-loop NTPase fold protein [Acidobacteriota bacterium]|nr:P-loop NTPase fold protein [Acidobacteriota bacterium]
MDKAFIIGVHGPWGAGKTSFCHMLATILENKNQTAVHYNAWQYEGDAYPVIPLLASLVTNSAFIKWAEEAYEGFKALLAGFKVSVTANVGPAKGKITYDAKNTLDRLDKIDVSTPQKELEKIQTETGVFSRQIDLLREQLAKRLEKKNRKIFIFIDDLDRCEPDRAIDLLEEIKLVLDLPGCVFVLALNERVLDGFIRKRYKEKYGIDDFTITEYIDKLIQLRIDVPDAEARIPELITHILQEGGVTGTSQEDLEELIKTGSGNNPRTAIRLANELVQLAADQPAEDELPVMAIERAVKIIAPDFGREINSFSLSRDYMRALIDDEIDTAPLEDFIDLFTPTRKVTLVKNLCSLPSGKKWLCKPTVPGVVMSKRPALLTRGFQDEPGGLERIMVLMTYYFETMWLEDAARALQQLRKIADYLRLLGNYRALALHGVSLVALLIDQLVRVSRQASTHVAHQIHPKFLEEPGAVGDMVKSWIHLCEAFVSALPCDQEALQFQRYLFQLENLNVYLVMKEEGRLEPNFGDLTSRMGIYDHHRVSASRFLRSDMRLRGELFAYLVALKSGAFFISQESKTLGEKHLAHHATVKSLLNNIEGPDAWEKLLNIRSIFIAPTPDVEDPFNQWITDLLTGCGSSEDVPNLQQILEGNRKEHLDLVNQLTEDASYYESQVAYLDEVLQALGKKNPELLAIHQLQSGASWMREVAVAASDPPPDETDAPVS